MRGRIVMSKKMDLRKLRKSNRDLERLSYLDLKAKYYEEVEQLKSRFPEVIFRTNAEIKFSALLSKNTKLFIFHSFWIGSYCVDLFFPSLGLAIEIDGEVHNREFKNKIDHSKIDRLAYLGIVLFSIENNDFNQETVKSFLIQISKLKKKDSRARQRMMRNIYLVTIEDSMRNNSKYE